MDICPGQPPVLNWYKDRMFCSQPRRKFFIVSFYGRSHVCGAVTLCKSYDTDNLKGMTAIRMGLVFAAINALDELIG